MKRLLSILLSLAIAFGLFVKVNAATTEKIDLKSAILIAKSSFEFNDKNLDFRYELTNYNNKSIWNLNWSSKNSNISIQVDANHGYVISMYSYDGNMKPWSKIPKFSKEKAREIAEAKIKKLVGEKFSEFIFVDNMETSLYSNTYDFRYVRKVNGIEYRDNFINISLERNTLKVINYAFEYDHYSLPGLQNVISLEKAKSIFDDKMGLELSYSIYYDYDKKERNIKLIYTPKNNVFPIDAFTGEIVKNNIIYANEKSMGGKGGDAQVLTPQEIKAIDENKNLISKEKVEEILSNKFGLTGEFKNEYLSLSYDMYTNRYVWSVGYSKNADDKLKYYYLSASIDAVTGEILYYSKGYPYIEEKDKTPKYSKEECRKIAEDFIKSMQPDRFNQTKYKENIEYNGTNQYYFSYVRIHQNVSVLNQGFNLGVNPYDGQIISYSMNWSDVIFPSIEGVISKDKALEILFSKNPFGLNYVRYYDYSKMVSYSTKLVYTFKSSSFNIDAKTGDMLDYNGKIVIENKKVTFTDIKNSPYNNDINILTDIGIIDDKTDKFNPNQMIKQKDFIKYLVRTLEPVYVIYTEDASKEYDNYYQIAIQKGIITEKEKNPNSNVTRQDAAKWIIKAMGGGFVAELSNLYTLNFKDAKLISKNYKGYIAIANELKIITPVKGFFQPKQPITKGEAARILVNYLKVEK
ncbi:hypothetical protein ABG79_02129 [Caloramator mitchellensis]|uniref:SLH domain-containing protein n=1 Tax=Caloramator mitchellensis TaxID=908809 RepID=A0A0R3K1D6_CALMK|nr:S-layer homology domain-containing protein [Caloramator mitchellensis]KRQ86095.1 hypothetical protein ABG79_02129 [Caloramator mitchellensis]